MHCSIIFLYKHSSHFNVTGSVSFLKKIKTNILKSIHKMCFASSGSSINTVV